MIEGPLYRTDILTDPQWLSNSKSLRVVARCMVDCLGDCQIKHARDTKVLQIGTDPGLGSRDAPCASSQLAPWLLHHLRSEAPC